MTALRFFACRLSLVSSLTSMDGRGWCHDNIFIERLWRSVKWELIYIKVFNDGEHLMEEVKIWFDFCNQCPRLQHGQPLSQKLRLGFGLYQRISCFLHHMLRSLVDKPFIAQTTVDGLDLALHFSEGFF